MLRTALVLGLLSLVGPFAIDMYLPALPHIAAGFGVPENAAQATITSYFFAFGLAQLIYGPMADQAGRRLPLFLGLAIFAAGSIGAALSGSIEALVGWRFLQGLGGAALMVVPRAVIRDKHTGPEAARLMAMIMLVIAVSPMLAPLAGSGVMALTSWRGVFWVLAVVAGLAILFTAVLQPETLRPEHRTRVNLRNLARGSRALLCDPMFMGLTFIGGFGMASFFVYVAAAPFVFTQHFNLTPTQFSLAFAFNAAGFFGASQFAGKLGEVMGMRRLVARGVAGFCLSSIVLAAVGLAGLASLPLMMGGLVVANAFLGVVIPSVMVMALDDHGDAAGLASSLGGTLQMVTGGVAVVLAGPFFDGTPGPMLVVIALCGVVALGLTLWALGERRVVAE